ncbi:hypothetical protein, partial [Cellulomonas cellasea]|uniref:hypothetical protein n=1 Tax=Cellulomonas cellasea TaxID=43670 RepID=UPI003F4F5585
MDQAAGSGGGQLAVQPTATAPVGALPDPMNPYVTVALGLSRPFHAAFFTVVTPPEVLASPFHACATLVPEGSVKEVDQLLSRVDPAFTVTEPWNPPGQEFCTAKVAVQVLPVGGGVVGGAVVGGGVAGSYT